MWKRTRRRDMADVNVYTAGRLSEMARSLGLLARFLHGQFGRGKRAYQGGCAGSDADGGGSCGVLGLQPVQSVPGQ